MADDKQQQIIAATRAKLFSPKRSFIPISAQQKVGTADPPAKGPVWVSRVTVPTQQYTGLREAVYDAIAALGTGQEQFDDSQAADVKAEWVGTRKGAAKDAQEPQISDKEKFEGLIKDVKSDTTIFYVHGGAMYNSSAAATRPAVATLAKLTGGRAFSTNYRLSPQASFPAALLDVLGAYLSLLHPPPGSFHQPVDPSKLVIAAESGGGYIVLALVLIIQYLQSTQGRQNSVIKLNGKDLAIPWPAGIALYAPEADRTHSLPSYTARSQNDFLAIPQPLLHPSFPPDHLWPTSPPRGDVYCETSAFLHPLISPCAAPPHLWSRDLPPFWFAYGEEQLRDDGASIARHLLDNDHGKVQWSEYEGLPHIFAFLFPMFPQSQHVFVSWAQFITQCVKEPAAISTRKTKYETADKKFRGKDISGEVFEHSYEDVLEMMRVKQAERPVWVGKDTKARL